MKAFVKKLELAIVSTLTISLLSVVAVPPAPASAAKPCIQRVFGWADRHSCVGLIQKLYNASRELHWRSDFIAVDSKYGPQTTTAIRKFQQEYGLKKDGVTGVNTWKKLCLIGGNNGYFTKDAVPSGVTAAYKAGCQVYGIPSAADLPPSNLAPFALPLLIWPARR